MEVGRDIDGLILPVAEIAFRGAFADPLSVDVKDESVIGTDSNLRAGRDFIKMNRFAEMKDGDVLSAYLGCRNPFRCTKWFC